MRLSHLGGSIRQKTQNLRGSIREDLLKVKDVRRVHTSGFGLGCEVLRPDSKESYVNSI